MVNRTNEMDKRMARIKTTGKLSRALLFALAICLVAATVLAEGAALPFVDAATKALDITSHKDLLWLSQAVALAAIGVVAYLIRIIVKSQADSIRAIDSLCAELKTRPCTMQRKDKE